MCAVFCIKIKSYTYLHLASIAETLKQHKTNKNVFLNKDDSLEKFEFMMPDAKHTNCIAC